MSDDLTTNEVIQGRAYNVPQFVALLGNRVNLPPGTILDIRGGTFLHNLDLGGNFEPTGNANLAQPGDPGNPNSVTDSADTTHNFIIAASEGNTVDGLTDSNLIAASIDSEISNNAATLEEVEQNAVIASNNCTITRTAVSGTTSVSNASIISSVNSLIEGNTTHPSPTRGLAIVASEQATIDSAQYSLVSSSLGSGIVSTPSDHNTTTLRFNNVAGSEGSIIEKTTTVAVSEKNLICSSANSTISDSVRTTLLACNTVDVWDCDNCTFIGANGLAAPAVSNSVVIGSPLIPIQSDMVTIASDVTVTGDFSVQSGYVHTERGLVQNYRELPNVLSALLATDYHVRMPVAGGDYTLPTAAAMGANFPLGTTREFYITSPSTATPTTIVTSGSDTFSQKPFWTRHTMDPSGGRLKLNLVNSLTPHWSIPDSINYFGYARGNTLNNFGISPPQVDASILPTSTSEPNHRTLTTTSYYYFDLLEVNSSLWVTAPSGSILARIPGIYKFTYQLTIFTDPTGTGTYLIRSDMIGGLTGLDSVPGTYQETGGANNKQGATHVTVTSAPVYFESGTPYTVRISQDSILGIHSTANIRVTLKIKAVI